MHMADSSLPPPDLDIPPEAVVGNARLQWRDDSDKHQGRMRAIAHFPGNWASHVFLNVPIVDALQSAVTELLDNLNNSSAFEPQKWTPIASPVHLSLSKLFMLRHHEVERFSAGLRQIAADQLRFRIKFGGDAEILANDDSSRFFIALLVDTGHRRLAQLAASVGSLLSDFGHETYYEEAKFHISIAWSAAACTSKATAQDIIEKVVFLQLDRRQATRRIFFYRYKWLCTTRP